MNNIHWDNRDIADLPGYCSALTIKMSSQCPRIARHIPGLSKQGFYPCAIQALAVCSEAVVMVLFLFLYGFVRVCNHVIAVYSENKLQHYATAYRNYKSAGEKLCLVSNIYFSSKPG